MSWDEGDNRRHRDWEEADPMTAAALGATGQFGESCDRQIASLWSAIEVLRAANDLETSLEQTGQYVITGSTMTKVRDHVGS